jgi:flagellar hook-associated protein 2
MGVTGGGISINGPSGIDDASIIDQLTALQQQGVTTVQNQVSQYQLQISDYSQFKSDLTSLQTSMNALNQDSSFDVFTSQSSDSSVATVQGGDGATAGQYNLGVYQLASAETMISKDNLITSQTNTLSSQGVNVGTISIDGTQITIDANDTIQDVRSKINNASDSSGNPLNVNASVLQVSPTDFRLVLTAKNTGSTGVDYQDVSGTTLKDLGIVSGTVDTTTQVVASQSPIVANFNALAAGTTIAYGGTDATGKAVSGSFVKATGATTLDAYLTQIGSTFGGTAKLDSSGDLVITNNTPGNNSIAVSSFTAMGAGTANYPMGASPGSDATAQQWTSVGPVFAGFSQLPDGTTIDFGGTDQNGNSFSDSFTTGNGNGLDQLTALMSKDFGATASVDPSGNLTITNNTPGNNNITVDPIVVTDGSTSVQTTTSMTSTVASPSVAQTLTSGNSFENDFNALPTGSFLTYAGTDHNGQTISGTLTTTNLTTALGQLGTAFGGAASVDANGELVITDGTTGVSKLSMSSLTLTSASNIPPSTYSFSTTTSGTQTGDKGSTTQVLQSQGDFQTAFNALVAGASIQYNGLDHNGNTVTNTYYKTAANTSISDFLSQVNNTFYGEATASIGTGGQLTLTDNIQGNSQLALSSLSINGGAAQSLSTVTPGKNGQGVLVSGQNSYFSYDGLMLSSASNNPDTLITGVTIQLHKAAPAETVQTSLTVDSATIQKNIQSVLDSYNSLLTWATAETKPADANDTTSKAGDLVNDMTVSSVMDQIRNMLMQSFTTIGAGGYNSLTMIGVNSDPDTGQLSIDQTQFTKALAANFDQIKDIFVTTGVSSNANITFGRNEATTQSGVYTLTEPNANQMTIQLAGSATSDTSQFRNGDIVTFSTGPAAGLSITAPSGSIGNGSATFTFSMGLSDQLSNLIDNFTDPNSGVIATTQNSLQDQVTDANNRITDLQEQVNNYHDQLVQQFSQMEQALNTMKSQEAQMMSALGASTTSTSTST